VSFAAVNLCVASQQVFIVESVYFVIDAVRKLLDTPSYNLRNNQSNSRLVSDLCENSHSQLSSLSSKLYNFIY